MNNYCLTRSSRKPSMPYIYSFTHRIASKYLEIFSRRPEKLSGSFLVCGAAPIRTFSTTSSMHYYLFLYETFLSYHLWLEEKCIYNGGK
jgi:hypothetical protein